MGVFVGVPIPDQRERRIDGCLYISDRSAAIN